ncbi:MAG: nuclear transport factor 2 family protein [Paraglaciecola sp.]|uniref:nuclear transport factor 2 family protein n=1 Tax=Paraglaciecola sp. TaxID=1920173 RepID=UPI003297AB9E
MSDLESRVTQLEVGLRAAEDRAKIIELTSLYARNVIHGDSESLVMLFTEDGILEALNPPNSGLDTSEARGHAGLREMYKKSQGLGLLPCVHNHIVELNGDTARCFCSLEVRFVQNGEPFIGSGYYEDELVRQGAEWRFKLRRVVMHHWAAHREGWS